VALRSLRGRSPPSTAHAGPDVLHVIAGTSDADQASEATSCKDDRYRGASDLSRCHPRIWTSDSPFNHHGEFYRVEGAYSDIKPYQQPYRVCFSAARRTAR